MCHHRCSTALSANDRCGTSGFTGLLSSVEEKLTLFLTFAGKAMAVGRSVVRHEAKHLNHPECRNEGQRP